MGDGISAMWDDADEYASLASYFGVEARVTPGGIWPYNMDDKHFYELKRLYDEKKQRRKE